MRTAARCVYVCECLWFGGLLVCGCSLATGAWLLSSCCSQFLLKLAGSSTTPNLTKRFATSIGFTTSLKRPHGPSRLPLLNISGVPMLTLLRWGAWSRVWAVLKPPPGGYHGNKMHA